MPKLLLVRHGDTKLHSGKRFWGRTDVPLSEKGIRQAEQLRERLKAQKITTAYASTLSRARVTAEIIASCHNNLSVTARGELDEINFGYVEGLDFDELKKLHPELAGQLLEHNLRPVFPGGESLDMLDERIKVFAERLKKHKTGDTLLVVSHFGALRVLICRLLGLGLDHWQQLQINLGSLSVVDTYPGGATLSLLNDISHQKA